MIALTYVDHGVSPDKSYVDAIIIDLHQGLFP
ncbi:MAG: hypothetical protein TECD_00566 [Hyphomicrobiaceae bacterium hypho_1]